MLLCDLGKELFGSGAGGGELGFQRVNQGHQLLHFGYDTLMLGKGGIVHGSAFDLPGFQPNPLKELGLEKFLGGQVELVFAGMDVGVLREGEFHHGIVLFAAEQQADGGILLWQLHVAVVVIDIHLHLTEVLMGEFAKFQIDDEVAAEDAVVKDEVEEVVVAIEGEPLLARLEEKAFSKLQKELFQVADDGGFQITLGVADLFIEAEEFEDVRFLEQILRRFDDLPLGGEAFHTGLVAAQQQALVQPGGSLTLQFGEGPVCAGGLNLVEAALVRILDGEEEDIVRPAQVERKFR